MTAKAKPAEKLPRWYRGADIPMRLIRKFAREVVDRFEPDRIILFGSYAYGTPHDDSDVDVLVVMPARNQLRRAAQIELDCDPPFPLDIIVRTPSEMQWRLRERESFLTEIVARGIVLHEKNHRRMDSPRGSRLEIHRKPRELKGRGA